MFKFLIPVTVLFQKVRQMLCWINGSEGHLGVWFNVSGKYYFSGLFISCLFFNVYIWEYKQKLVLIVTPPMCIESLYFINQLSIRDET